METLIVPKEEITVLDIIKKNYYERIEVERKRAAKFFKVRDFEMCKRYIEEIKTIALHAYDLETLRNTFQLKALVCIFFDDY